MTGTGDLFWPGAPRAAGLVDDEAFLTAMVAVEQAWLDALVVQGIAPPGAGAELAALVSSADLPTLAGEAEGGGNPVIGLVGMLRERADQDTARWLHRGLTSQDVLDTALMLLTRTAIDRVTGDLRAQLRRLAELARTHRDHPAIGRTLTQHGVPITIGLRIAGWSTGIAEALETVERIRGSLPVQLGGACGTHAAVVELAGDLDAGMAVVAHTAEALGLRPTAPWHGSRGTITEIGDSLVRCTDAWGHLAADVTTLARPEIGELREGVGGGSSTMPQKSNPVLAVLLRRAALAAPPLASTLHLAAAAAVEERPDGAWHAEAATVRLLLLRTVVAAGQARDLLDGLVVDVARASANLDAAHSPHAEQDVMAGLTGRTPLADYTGAAGRLVDAAVERATRLGVET